MVIGELAQDQGMYRNAELTVRFPDDYEARLQSALMYLPENAYQRSETRSQQPETGQLTEFQLPISESRLPPGSFFIGKEGQIFQIIDDTGRADKLTHRDCIGRVVGPILAGDPVHRRIEVGAGVLAEGERVPIPGRPFFIVVRNDVDREPRRLGEDLRQFNDRRIGSQRLREINDFDATIAQLFDEEGENSNRCAHSGFPCWLY